MRRRPSIEAAEPIPDSGSSAATTEDRAIQTCLPSTSSCASLERCARIAHAAPGSGRWAQNTSTLHADLAVSRPATMRPLWAAEEPGNSTTPGDDAAALGG
jgi:hypothetical protein